MSASSIQTTETRFRETFFHFSIRVCFQNIVLRVFCFIGKRVIAKYILNRTREETKGAREKRNFSSCGVAMFETVNSNFKKFHLLQWPCRRCSRPVPNKDVAGVIPIQRSILAAVMDLPSAVWFSISPPSRRKRCTETNQTTQSPEMGFTPCTPTTRDPTFRSGARGGLQNTIESIYTTGTTQMAYFARRIDLFLQAVQARLFHAFYFLDDGYVRAPFTTHRIFEPPCPHLQTRTTRGGTFGPMPPVGGFAVRSKRWQQTAVVRLLFATEVKRYDVVTFVEFDNFNSGTIFAQSNNYEVISKVYICVKR